MSSLPMLLSLIDELDRDAYYGNDFGFGLYPQQIRVRPHYHQYHREPTAINLNLPLSLMGRHPGEKHLTRRETKKDGQLSAIGKDGFQVCMEVSQFKPNELNVKVVDNCIVVEGKHEEREDNHGFISRHFVRRYSLPPGYDANKVASTLSSDGVLTVSIPKPQIEDKSSGRAIQIQQVGPAHLNVKQNTQEEQNKKSDANDSNGDSAKKSAKK